MYGFGLPMHLYSSSQSACTLCMGHMLSIFLKTLPVSRCKMARESLLITNRKVFDERKDVLFKLSLKPSYLACTKKSLFFQSVSIVLYGSEEPSLFFWCSVKSQSCVRVCVNISDIKKDVYFCLLNTSIVSLVFFYNVKRYIEVFWSSM